MWGLSVVVPEDFDKMADSFKRLFPKAYFHRLQEKGIRVDGRTNEDARKVTVVTSAISTSDASALCTIGRTTALCGITCEVITPLAATPDEGMVQVDVEIGGLCSANPSESSALRIKEILDLCLDAGLINKKELGIVTSKAAWVLKCHILCIDDDGNLKDACTLALVQALQSLRLYSDVLIAESDGQIRIVSPKRDKKLTLCLQTSPCTAGVCEGIESIIVDPTAEEEVAVDSCASLLVDKTNGDCLMLHKSGGVPLSNQQLEAMLAGASKRQINVTSS